jgi:histone H3/H4
MGTGSARLTGMQHHEPARDLPITESCDVLVAGSGPAGVCAAIAAARSGARTRLIEVHGCLGGIWTAGSLGWVIDAANKDGILREILQRAGQTGVRPGHGRCLDAELLKLVLETMCREAGVQVRLHTRVVAAARDAANRLAVAVTESPSGRAAGAARAFVDATGDGHLAAAAGCGFDYGRVEGDGVVRAQPMSLLAVLAGVHEEAIAEAVHDSVRPWGTDAAVISGILARHGIVASYGHPMIFPIHDDLFVMMANHEYGVSGLDAQQITDATMRARAEVHAIVAALRSEGGPWAGLRLVSTGAQIGIREGRRIRGRYQVVAADLVAGARQPDAVCRVSFGVDIHATDPNASTGVGSDGIRSKPYDIPLRALIAADCDGLLLAGRCISGDFHAHASYRVTGDAAALGQAAGTCAALAAQQGCLPHQVAFTDLAARLPAPGTA